MYTDNMILSLLFIAGIVAAGIWMEAKAAVYTTTGLVTTSVALYYVSNVISTQTFTT